METFLAALGNLLSALTPFVVALVGYWLKQMLDKQNLEIAQIKGNTNGVLDKIADASRSQGKQQVVDAVAKVAPQATAQVVAEVKKTDAAQASIVAEVKAAEQIKDAK